MKQIVRTDEVIVLRFDPGEEVMAALAAFCKNAGITAAHFTGIGAAARIDIAWYSRERKGYQTAQKEGDYEVCSLTGNVSAAPDGAPFVHAHGVFAAGSGEVFGGHVKQLVISATGEITVHPIAGALRRAYSDTIGINILD